jgi:mono/diheme cytochrome c family protein
MKSIKTWNRICSGALKLALPMVIALPAFLCQPASGALVSAIVNYDGLNDSTLPAKLSQTGMYTNIGLKTRAVTAGIVPFEVNSPLWSDAAHKTRWISVPSGKKVTPSDSDHYQFPDGTVFLKNFGMDSVYGDTTTSFIHETRFLIIRISGTDTAYLGITYRWNRQNTDGVLVPPSSGLDTGISFRYAGRPGVSVAKRWHYPSTVECAQCHQGRGVLGFLTPQLNKGGAGANNQLAKLVTAGVLASNPVAAKPALLNFAWHGASETGVSDTVKARSYFAANCSQCHGNGHVELEGAGHDFDWLVVNKDNKYKPRIDSSDTHPFVDPGNPGGYIGRPSSEQNYPQVIFAGYPESSYVMRRIMSRGDLLGPSLYQMPPLATYQPDTAAFTMMKNFICSLKKPLRSGCAFPVDTKDQKDSIFYMFPDSPDTTFSPWTHHVAGVSPTPFAHKLIGFHAMVRGRNLSIEGAVLFVKVGLFDIRGREVPITRIRTGEYYINGELIPGVYIVRAGRNMGRVQILP